MTLFFNPSSWEADFSDVKANLVYVLSFRTGGIMYRDHLKGKVNKTQLRLFLLQLQIHMTFEEQVKRHYYNSLFFFFHNFLEPSYFVVEVHPYKIQLTE